MHVQNGGTWTFFSDLVQTQNIVFINKMHADRVVGNVSAWDDYIQHSLRDLDTKQLRRHLVDSYGFSGYTLYNGNDYLGLSSHPRVREAAARVVLQHGNGPRSSPLVSGYTHYHRDLERCLSKLKETEDALLFSSGFAANMSVLSSLLKDGAVDVFSDELNHASIIDGLRLGSKDNIIHVYRHNDMDHLEELLSKSRNERKILITDSLFSMDGDFANLPEIVRKRSKYGFLLIIDEAHATLVCGKTGGGAAEMFGVQNSIDIHIGTLSKAIGSQGGFVACSTMMKDYFLNKGRAYVFSTSLPLCSVVSAHEAIRVHQSMPWRQEHLRHLIQLLCQNLGVKDHHPASPIIPLLIGSEEKTLKIAELLRNHHRICVAAIRPPTVPISRLRISLSAEHTDEMVDELSRCLSHILHNDTTEIYGSSKM